MSATTATTCAKEMRSLWRAARWCGVAPSYENVRGERVRATPEAVLHAVRAFGVDIDAPADAEAALRELQVERESRFIEPVNVVWTNGRDGAAGRAPLRITLHLAKDDADGVCECRLACEDDGERAWQVELSEIPALERLGRAVLKPLDLPGPLPIGYHRLEVELRKRVLRSWVFVAPRRVREFDSRCWGAFLPLHALRSDRNWGIGDYTDLSDLNTWIGERGGAVFGTLPLLALSTHIDESNPSPYTPTSRMFWNEMYIDVEASPEFRECAEARALCESSECRDAVARLRSSDVVEYGAMASLKRRALEMMARTFFESAPASRREALEREMARDPELEQYAAFRAGGERTQETWPHWPAAARDGRLDAGDYDESAKKYHLYAQLLCIEQLSRAAGDADDHGCGLYLDLPVGVHPHGFDAWRFRDAFVHDASAGAPPDEFFTHGQNWGILPLHPQRTREDGHSYFRKIIASHLRYASALRIDHVMWMHRMYWAPHGMPASEGVYVRYPAEELYAILCIESHRSGVPIIGENLGTVPNAVDRSMERHGINPLYVAQFAWTDKARRPIAPPQKNAVASLNTHDTPTFAEYWHGGDIERRVELDLLSADQAEEEKRGRENVRRSVLDFVRRHRVRLRAGGRSDDDVVAIASALLVEMAGSEAAVILVALEDLWAETRPQNVPGTQGDTHWRRKAAHTLEEMRSMPQLTALFERLKESMP